jgi:hypothetical protein
MHYLLIEVRDEDENDKVLYSFSSKLKAEKKLEELIVQNRLIMKISQEAREMSLFYASTLPLPCQLDLVSLPPRNLVWDYNSWNNAYMMEYEETIAERNRLIDRNNKKIIRELSQTYLVSEKELQDIFYCYSSKEYFIQEVASD